MELKLNTQLDQPLTMEMSKTPSGMAALLCQAPLPGDTSQDGDTHEQGPHAHRW